MHVNILFQIAFAGVVFGWEHISSNELSGILSKENVDALVAFVAPWTEPCKALEPEWLHTVEGATKLMYSIDCTTEVAFCKDQEIISYPTIRLVRQRKTEIYTVERYRGPRKSAAISAYLQRISHSTATLDVKNIAEFKTSDEIVFIAYIESSDATLTYNFNILATRHKDKFTFGTADQSLAVNEGVSPGCVVRYMDSEEPQSICGEWKLDVLESFLGLVTAPMVGEITRGNELKYLRSGKSLVYLFGETEEERNGFKLTFRALAKRYAEYLSFVTVDAVEYAAMAPALGLIPGLFPALAVQNPSVGQVFPYEQGKAITEQIVEAFVMDIAGGRIQPGPRAPPKDAFGHTEL